MRWLLWKSRLRAQVRHKPTEMILHSAQRYMIEYTANPQQTKWSSLASTPRHTQAIQYDTLAALINRRQRRRRRMRPSER